MANSVSSTSVTATTTHPGATAVVKLGGVTDSDGTVNLAVGANVITVEVTAEDGTTMQTYTVTVTRAASADATLRSLSLSGVTLSPSFTSGTTSYTASVANSVSSTSVTAATTHDGATAVVKLGGVTDTDGTVGLAVGANVITVEVTAEDGTTMQTYTVTVTRAAAPPPTPMPTPTLAPTPSGSTDTDRSSNTPPRFVEGVEAAREVSENAEAGTPIGDPLRAVDRDGDRLTYSLTGADASLFTIDKETGQLRTKAALDYETQRVYNITVRVQDGGRDRDSIAVTVEVIDEPEPTPTPTPTPAPTPTPQPTATLTPLPTPTPTPQPTATPTPLPTPTPTPLPTPTPTAMPTPTPTYTPTPTPNPHTSAQPNGYEHAPRYQYADTDRDAHTNAAGTADGFHCRNNGSVWWPLVLSRCAAVALATAGRASLLPHTKEKTTPPPLVPAVAESPTARIGETLSVNTHRGRSRHVRWPKASCGRLWLYR